MRGKTRARPEGGRTLRNDRAKRGRFHSGPREAVFLGARAAALRAVIHMQLASSGLPVIAF